MPLNPQNPYAVAKVSQELLGKLYATIGKYQSGAENKMSVGNINVARDFSDVRDVVDAYYKILHR